MKICYLNIGCGAKAHPSWHNVDLNPCLPNAIAMDASKPLPFHDASMDVVYSSAMIEHLDRPAVPIFLKECLRVLTQGGILRIGVPDFERACRLYLEKLEAAYCGIPGAALDHEWMIIEMIDQFVRDVSGGEMARVLARPELPNLSFIVDRIGVDGEIIRNSLLRQAASSKQDGSATPSLFRRVRFLLTRWLTGFSGRELFVGRFRMSGEVHRWAYDRFSVSVLLKQAGFVQTLVQNPYSSRIPDWEKFRLDVAEDGRSLKPDLLYVEALKPKSGR